MSTQTQIRLTKNSEIEKVLSFLKSVYPLLSETEIVKLSLSQTYKSILDSNSQNIPFAKQPFLSEEIQEGLKESKEDLKNGKFFAGDAKSAMKWLQDK